MRRLPVAATAALAALLLAGCAAPLGADGAGGPDGPIPTPTPTPTAACVVPEEVEAPDDCVPLDVDANFRSNEAYRERSDPGAAGERAQHLVEPTLAALRPLADGAAPLTEDALVAALVAAGSPADSIQRHGSPEAGYAFGVHVGDGACLVGGVVVGREPTAEIDGLIADGGCLPAIGH